MENLQDYDFKFFGKIENCEESATGRNSSMSKLADVLKNLKTTDETIIVLKAIMSKLTQTQRNQIFEEFGCGKDENL